MTPPPSTGVLDAPVTTIDYDADDSRPLQQIPTTEFKARWEQFALAVFILVPLLAVASAGFVVWGHGLSVTDVVLSTVFYAVTLHGITVGFHRYFTHGSFKAHRWLRIALAVAGSMAIEGPVTRWVADHRRHHAFSDAEGDPHSPWRYGNDFRSLCKGLYHAHVGWLFDVEQTDQKRFVPDLLADKDVARVAKLFPLFVTISLLLPAVLGGLISSSWTGALTAFFWASVIRIGVLHHITWSINSICHTWGSRPFKTRDRAVNVWWLAAISGGESWHNLHHADPTCARHGVDKGQIDSSARVIALFERLGWASDVRWPKKARLDARRSS
ncbi:MAG: fatty acid desaturase [Actinobacteria bacterium]|nr:fatty acid desaturase [Actinomycetota bacterium]MCA1721001.1 fatty acid desaturase [Actinomycetota bacterium]